MKKMQLLPQLDLFQATPVELPLPNTGTLAYPEKEIQSAYFGFKQQYGLDVVMFYTWQDKMIVTGEDIKTVGIICKIPFLTGQRYIAFDQQLMKRHRETLNKYGYRVGVFMPVGSCINHQL